MAEIQGGEEYNNYSNGEKVKTSDEFNIYHLPAGCWPPRLRSNTFSKIMTFGRGFGLIILAKMFACVWAESGPGPVWPSCADTATLQIQAHAFANNATPCQIFNQYSSLCLVKNFKKLITPEKTKDKYAICFQCSI